MTSFVYNPLSHRFDLTGITTLPPGTVGALTGNTGGAVSPDGSNNINVLGSGIISIAGNPGANTLTVGIASTMTNGQLIIGNTGTTPSIGTLSTSNGINVTNGAGTITLSNLRDASRYVVSSVTGQAAYSTIQSAINQAVSDGASSSTPAVVLVFSGVYTENLVLAPFVSIACLSPQSGATIVGSITYSGVGHLALVNLSLQATGSSTALQHSGNGTIQLSECKILASSGVALDITTQNSQIETYSCVIFSNTGSPVNLNDATCDFHTTTIAGDSSACVWTGSLMSVNIISCKVLCHFTISEGVADFFNCIMESLQPLVILSSGATVVISSSYANCLSNSGFFAEGTGNILISSLNSFGTAQSLSPSLTIGESINHSKTLATYPVDSSNGGLSLGSAYQNPNDYDVILTVYLKVNSSTNANILCGTSVGAVPSQQTVVSALTVAAQTIIPVPVYLPANYYVLLSTSGTISATITGQMITPV